MYTIGKKDKLKSLIAQLRAREQEVFNYQVNIDNYTIAIPLATEGGDFRLKMEKLLVTEKDQQYCAQLMLDVVESQLEDEDIAELLGEFHE